MGDTTHLLRTTALPEGVAVRLPLLIHKLGEEIFVRAEPLLTAAGLTGRQYTALAILQADRPRSQQDLASLMGCVPALVVSVVDDLEQAGYVERARDPADRRRSVVALTAAGRRALAQGDRIGEQVEAELLAHVPAADRARLHAALRTALGPSAAVDAAA